jgi:hypothetical protein
MGFILVLINAEQYRRQGRTQRWFRLQEEYPLALRVAAVVVLPDNIN